ncbi:hypothetical protein A9267_10930 [Shewanella sp. UCD-FRSSP16_17]|uniref:tetratricopeptide repeat protein n=1 Tax=Shewanella sp. UCD-FRSSP16_17 TaxID=1853256 RepID=UPI0007EEF49E|nr:hypothetical protein [Shewanella sp. UCD-FRSSP16_17]OBT08223.1 hypothetical protein A9267_10930 [Shewanella sp. UCD-FRSSP16_17]
MFFHLATISLIVGLFFYSSQFPIIEILQYKEIAAECIEQLKEARHIGLDEVCANAILDIAKVSKIQESPSTALAFVFSLIYLGGCLGGMINFHHFNDESGKEQKEKISNRNLKNTLFYRLIRWVNEDEKQEIYRKAAIGFAAALIGIPFLMDFVNLDLGEVNLHSANVSKFVSDALKLIGLAGICGFLGTKVVASLAFKLLDSQLKENSKKLDDVEEIQNSIVKNINNLSGSELLAKGLEALDKLDKSIIDIRKKYKEQRKEVSDADIEKEAFRSLIADMDRAIERLKTASSLLSDHHDKATSYGLLGYIYKRKSRVEDALKVAVKAVDTDPHNPVWHFNFVCYLALLDEKGKNIEDIEAGFVKMNDCLRKLHKSKREMWIDIINDEFNEEHGDFNQYLRRTELKNKVDKIMLEN